MHHCPSFRGSAVRFNSCWLSLSCMLSGVLQFSKTDSSRRGPSPFLTRGFPALSEIVDTPLWWDLLHLWQQKFVHRIGCSALSSWVCHYFPVGAGISTGFVRRLYLWHLLETSDALVVVARSYTSDRDLLGAASAPSLRPMRMPSVVTRCVMVCVWFPADFLALSSIVAPSDSYSSHFGLHLFWAISTGILLPVKACKFTSSSNQFILQGCTPLERPACHSHHAARRTPLRRLLHTC